MKSSSAIKQFPEEKILIKGDYEYKRLSIYEPLHQAITQQMKELGWLE